MYSCSIRIYCFESLGLHWGANAFLYYVASAVEIGHQEEVDGAVGSRQVRGPASHGALAAVLALQRRRQHLELRDTVADQEI